jgi:hypothetical protein
MKLLKLLNNGGNLGGNAANIEAAGIATRRWSRENKKEAAQLAASRRWCGTKGSSRPPFTPEPQRDHRMNAAIHNAGIYTAPRRQSFRRYFGCTPLGGTMSKREPQRRAVEGG